jgi:hypothetical protein
MFLDEDARAFGEPLIRLLLDQSDGSLAISSQRQDELRTTHAHMRLNLSEDAASPPPLDVADVQAGCVDSVAGETFYASTGNDYRGEFHGLCDAWAGGIMCLSRVSYECEQVENMHLRACAFMDACAHGQRLPAGPLLPPTSLIGASESSLVGRWSLVARPSATPLLCCWGRVLPRHVYESTLQ